MKWEQCYFICILFDRDKALLSKRLASLKNYPAVPPLSSGTNRTLQIHFPERKVESDIRKIKLGRVVCPLVFKLV